MKSSNTLSRLNQVYLGFWCKIKAYFKFAANYRIGLTAIISLLYILAVLASNPFGDFPINDDWDMFLHVRYFLSGHFTKNSLIDATFIFQGLLAMVWAKIFGLSFVSLRILTIIVTIFIIPLVIRFLNKFDLSKSAKALTTLTLIFNPLFFASSLTFMTEIYYIFTLILVLLFYKNYRETNRFIYLILTCVLAGIGLLIRQFGVVTFVALLGATLFEITALKTQLIFIAKRLTVIVAIFGIFLFVSLQWPQYVSPNDKSIGLTGFFILQEDALNRVNEVIRVLPYLGLFLLPFSTEVFIKTSKKARILVLLSGLLFFKSVFSKDIFSIGNVFYIEGLYKKNDFINNLSIFDNSIFKIALTYIVICSISTIILFCLSKLRDTKFDRNSVKENSFYILLILGNFAVTVLSKKFLDRYFINFFLLLIIFAGVQIYKNQKSASRLSIVALIFITSITIIQNYEFMTANSLKWKQTKLVQQAKSLRNNIYVNGAYTRYTYVSEFDDVSKVNSHTPKYLEYLCYVQQYTEDTENPILQILTRLDTSRTFNKYFLNPKIYDSDQTRGLQLINNHKDRIIYKEEYFSPIYNFIGKRAYVGSFCVDPKKPKPE